MLCGVGRGITLWVPSLLVYPRFSLSFELLLVFFLEDLRFSDPPVESCFVWPSFYSLIHLKSSNPADPSPFSPPSDMDLNFKGEVPFESGGVCPVQDVISFFSCLIQAFKSSFSSFNSSYKE